MSRGERAELLPRFRMYPRLPCPPRQPSSALPPCFAQVCELRFCLLELLCTATDWSLRVASRQPPEPGFLLLIRSHVCNAAPGFQESIASNTCSNKELSSSRSFVTGFLWALSLQSPI